MGGVNIEIKIIGLDKLTARLGQFPVGLYKQISEFVASQTDSVYTKARNNVTERFRQFKGALLNSINSSFASRDTTATGTVGAYGIAYAKIQEYGGSVNLPEIRPVRAKALLFNRLGFSPMSSSSRSSQFSSRSAAHKVTIPERSFLRLALVQQRAEFTGGIREIVAKAAKPK